MYMVINIGKTPIAIYIMDHAGLLDIIMCKCQHLDGKVHNTARDYSGISY